jgi:hypothetical protein
MCRDGVEPLPPSSCFAGAAPSGGPHEHARALAPRASANGNGNGNGNGGGGGASAHTSPPLFRLATPTLTLRGGHDGTTPGSAAGAARPGPVQNLLVMQRGGLLSSDAPRHGGGLTSSSGGGGVGAAGAARTHPASASLRSLLHGP